MPLRAYCEEIFRITVSLGLGSALGEKGKKTGQIGKISASEASRARFFLLFFFPKAYFSPPFPHNEKPGARFSKVPIINGPGKLSPFTFKIKVSIVLHLT